MGGECPAHGEVMKILGERVEADRHQTMQIEKIFGLLGDIKTAVDQNAVRAVARDQKLSEIEDALENGLRSEVRQIHDKVKVLTGCWDRRKKAREEGVEGFFVKGFRKIHDNGGLIVIVALGYLVLTVLIRTKFFGDAPEGLLKALGIG